MAQIYNFTCTAYFISPFNMPERFVQIRRWFVNKGAKIISVRASSTRLGLRYILERELYYIKI